MKGGLTVQEMATRKRKADNLDKALRWLEGRVDSEKLLALDAILRDGVAEAEVSQ